MIVKNKGWLAGQKSRFSNFEMYKKILNHVTNVFPLFFEIRPNPLLWILNCRICSKTEYWLICWLVYRISIDMIDWYNSTTNIKASPLSQADLLEIYKAEGGGKSSWHDGRAPINLTTQEWCLLLWQDYKYKPIHDRQICLGKSNIFCTNVSLISLSSQYIWTKNECTISPTPRLYISCLFGEEFAGNRKSFDNLVLPSNFRHKAHQNAPQRRICQCFVFVIHWTAYPSSLWNWNISALYLINLFRNNRITKKICLRFWALAINMKMELPLIDWYASIHGNLTKWCQIHLRISPKQLLLHFFSLASKELWARLS